MINHILSLLRSARDTSTKLALQDVAAGPAGSEAHLRSQLGTIETAKVSRSATFPRRTVSAARQQVRLADRWRWERGGLKMTTVTTELPDARLILVVPPGHGLSPRHARQTWTALAPLKAGRRSPFFRLFAGTR